MGLHGMKEKGRGKILVHQPVSRKHHYFHFFHFLFSAFFLYVRIGIYLKIAHGLPPLVFSNISLLFPLFQSYYKISFAIVKGLYLSRPKLSFTLKKTFFLEEILSDFLLSRS